MKFTKIDSSLPRGLVDAAWGKFEELLLELGVRDDNTHVGTGLGGNNFQLYSLLGVKHSLMKLHKGIIVTHDDGIYWDAETLAFMPRLDMRKKVDTIIPLVEERYPGAFLFSKEFGDATKINYLKLVSREMQGALLNAQVLCSGLAKELDAGDTSNILMTAKLLEVMPFEIVLLAVRKFIGIERLVKFSLDEHSRLGPILHRINKIVDT
jgi:hypothetical protein